jgi:tetratricopeptide (TPR) repeat protein
MKITKLAFFLSALLLITACKSQRQKALDSITIIEQEAFTESGMIDPQMVNNLTQAYIDFADQFPEDSLAPEYIFKAGDIFMNTNRSNNAIKMYNRIIEDYSDYRKSPEALFLKGYVYENNLGRLDQARAIYEEFLGKYPDNDFAKDAEISLKYLGKSPEELIEIFQQMNEENTKDN